MIDDNPVRGEAILKQINTPGSKVTTSDHVIELLAAQSQQKSPPYQIVIVDEDAQCDCMSLNEQINQMRYDVKPVFILLQQSRHKSGSCGRADTSSYFTSIPKPVRPSQLINVLVDAWRVYQENKVKRVPSRDSYHVLLVEDNELNQKIAKIMLEEMGCKVDVANCGMSALHQCNNAHDIIFMDLGLPDIDGLSLTEEIRKKENHRLDTPIIALTAHASDHDKKRCLSIGMNDFLTKPISYENLQIVLARWVKRSNEHSLVSQVI